MAEDRSIRVRLIADIRNYQQGLANAGRATADFGRQVSGMGSAATVDIERVGRSALVLSGGMALALGAAAKAAIDWETAWAGVTKTVDGTATELDALEQGLRNMAKELPASHREIAGVAEAAGQLGIGVNDVEKFTKVMVDLGETTNLTAEDAATSLARISNIMGTSADDVDRMGATIVELGNNSATTEREIVELATRLAAAGRIAGLSEADVFAFASTLTSVGVEAEAGGTALSKVFTKVRDAVLDGGEALDTFARVAGVSSEQFVAAFERSSADAIEMFISGLGRMNEAGQSTTTVFQDLELTDQRLMRALLSTASAGELLSDQLGMAARAWEENEALQTEAEKRYQTTAAQMEMLRNQVVDLGIDLGASLLPAIRAVTDVLGTMFEGVAAMPGPLKSATVGVAALATAGLGMVGIVGTLAPKIQAAHDALMRMGTGGQFVARNMGRMGMAMGGATIGLGLLALAMGDASRRAQKTEEDIKGFADAMREAEDAVEGTQRRLEQLVGDQRWLRELLDDAGVSVEDFGAALSGTSDEWDAMVGGLRTFLAESDPAKYAVFVHQLEEIRSEAEQGKVDFETLGRVMGDTGDQAERVAPKIGTLAHEMGLSAEEAEKARDEFDKLLAAYRGAVDPLFGVLDALRANREAMGEEAEFRAQGLERIAEAQEDVADAERDLRDAMGEEDNASGIAAAEERLADARERLAQVSQDAIPTQEQVAKWNQEAAESALDLEIASRELAARIREQPALLEDAIGMLRSWRDNGLLTEEQARDMEEQFRDAAVAANELSGDWVASVYLVGGDEVQAQLDGILQKIVEIESPARYSAGAAYNQWLADQQRISTVRPRREVQARAAGGPYRPGWVLTGEHGPELEYKGHPGMVLSNDSLNQLGAMFHGGMLAGTQMHPAQMPIGSTIDQSSRTTINAPITVSDTRTAADTQYKLRVLEASLG